MNEELNQNLDNVCKRFEEICWRLNIEPNLVTDEPEIQSYTIDKAHTQEIKDEIQPYADSHEIQLEAEDGKFIFTVGVLSDGHWAKLSPKRDNMSPFANPEDAKKVKKKKTIFQQNKELEEMIDEGLQPKIIAVDLDGTLAKLYDKYDPNSIPDPRPHAKEAIRALRAKGYRVIINTVRGDTKLIQKWLDKHGIKVDQINHNPDQPENSSHKICADIYIDDKAIDGRKSWKEIEKQITGRLKEDQYKSPTGKHRRSQTTYPSSFSKSKSFGGVTEARANNISGSSIPMQLEIPIDYGINSAQRSNSDGEKKKIRPYNKRKDATDNPTAIEDEDLQERNIVTTKRGRTNDTSVRRLTTRRIVPDLDHGPEKTDGPEGFSGSTLTDRINKSISRISKDNVKYPEPDPMQDAAKEVNMRPLGVFGPADKRQPNGGPVSNVSIQHPNDRSFDNTAPKITVTGKRRSSPKPPKAVVRDRSDPLRQADYDNPTGAASVEEGLVRPEDGYEFMQLLARDLGLSVEPRKIKMPHRTFVKICDGTLRLEYDDPDNIDRVGELTIYKRGRKISSTRVDLGKDTIVDEIGEEVLDANSRQ